MKFAHRLKQTILPLTLLEMVFGLFLIIFNVEAQNMIIKMLGIIAASYGIITFTAWAIRREGLGLSVIITSVLGVVAGAFLIFLTDNVTHVSMIIFGILVGVFGASKFPEVFAAKSSGFKQWWIIFFPILIIIGAGIFIGLNPTVSTSEKYSLSMILIGSALLVGCIADFMTLGGIVHSERMRRPETADMAQLPADSKPVAESKQD